MKNDHQINNGRRKRFERTFQILKLVAGGVIVLSSFAAPNVATLLPLIFPKQKGSTYPRPSDISRSLIALKKRGFVKLERSPSGAALRLTPRGEKLYNHLFLNNYILPKPKKWDGCWRIVIFDINEKNKRVRELIRQRLCSLGFTRLQDSVWLYPYDCEEVVELLKTAHRVRYDVHYLLVKKMAQDSKWRKHFSLDSIAK